MWSVGQRWGYNVGADAAICSRRLKPDATYNSAQLGAGARAHFLLFTFHFEVELVPVRGFDTLRKPESAVVLAFSGIVRLVA
jgi:hypothetical protein